jgi:hypothetical protein
LAAAGDKINTVLHPVIPAFDYMGNKAAPVINSVSQTAGNVANQPIVQSTVKNIAGSKLTGAPVKDVNTDIGHIVTGLAGNYALSRAVPGAGGILSAISASNRMNRGDRMGAYIDRIAALSSGASLVPVVAPAAIPINIGANVLNGARDSYLASKQKYNGMLSPENILKQLPQENLASQPTAATIDK